MDSFKRALENIGRMWANLTATQRVILSGASAAMVLLLVWGSIGTTDAWVRVVGREVDDTTRAKVLQKLQQGQKYELRDREIYVPKQDADRVVLELAGDGTMNDDAVGKFLEEDNIFRTRATHEALSKKALEQRLAIMIRKIDAVKNASVLTRPSSKSYSLGFEGSAAGASVQVELHENRALTPKNVIAIAGLVAKAVPDLKPEDVHIMDTKANPYRAPKENDIVHAAAFWRDYERAIEEDIQNRIKAAFRGASVVVRIQAKNSDSEIKEVRHSNPKVKESTDSKRVERTGGSSQGAVQKGEGLGPVEGTVRTDETATTEKHIFDETQRMERNPAGEIQKIKVGVLIPIGPEEKDLTEAKKLLPTIKEWIKMAAGTQATEDSVSVSFLPSQRPEPIAAVPAPDRAFEWISAHAAKIALVALALAGLFVMARVLRGVTAKDSVEELQALTAALTENQEAAADLAIPAEGDFGRLKQGLQDMVGRNPQTVAASLRSFMSGR
jgi:flagellar biosynthesis/type III secretory pathway M-ring protein FliF/YscJ